MLTCSQSQDADVELNFQSVGMLQLAISTICIYLIIYHSPGEITIVPDDGAQLNVFTKVITIHRAWNMDVCTKFHDNSRNYYFLLFSFMNVSTNVLYESN